MFKILQDEWVVTSVDLGGTVEVYRGPSFKEAVEAYVKAKANPPKELAVLIEHQFRAI